MYRTHIEKKQLHFNLTLHLHGWGFLFIKTEMKITRTNIICSVEICLKKKNQEKKILQTDIGLKIEN